MTKGLVKYLSQYYESVRKAEKLMNKSLVGKMVIRNSLFCGDKRERVWRITSVNEGELLGEVYTKMYGQKADWYGGRIYVAKDRRDWKDLKFMTPEEIDAGLEEWAKDDWPHASDVWLEAA